MTQEVSIYRNEWILKIGGMEVAYGPYVCSSLRSVAGRCVLFSVFIKQYFFKIVCYTFHIKKKRV
jgi:hypothetical protein